MEIPMFGPSYLAGGGGVQQGDIIPLKLPSSLVRPTSPATREVNQARIRKENEERLANLSGLYDYVTNRGNLMFNDAGVVMQDAYDNASESIPQALINLKNFAEDVSYNTSRDMAPIFQLGRDIKEGAGPTFDAVVSGAKEHVDPMLQEISRGIDNLATSQLINKVADTASSVSDSISQLFSKDETSELPKKINTDATLKVTDSEVVGTSPEGAEDKQNWFNAINDRVDLMAMGAAMLAGSGQRGATTMSRLGEGLQAGLSSRAAQAKEAENKQYRDAVLLLQAQKARAAGITDPHKNYSSKINDISAFMAGSGFEGDNLTDLSRLVHGLDSNFVGYPAPLKKAIVDAMAKESSNWFSSGSELDTPDAAEAYLKAKKLVIQGLTK